MAHMIDETRGAPAIAYAGATPWHRLGKKMTDAERRNVTAALKLAGLDWRVDTIPLMRMLEVPGVPGTGTSHIQHTAVPDAKGIIRIDTGAYLGTVGAGFTPIQHTDAFRDILEPLIDNHKCTVEVMASLAGGARQFALVKMPDATITPSDGDDVRGYFCLTNGHDGSQAFRGILTPIRVVCQNTLSMAQSGKLTSAVSIRHTKSAPERVRMARELVERMQEALTKTGETYAQLAARTMNAKELAEYIEAVIPQPKADDTLSDVLKLRRETIADLIFHGHHVADGVTDASTGIATAWRAYNAVTEYFDHVRVREAKSASARIANMDSALFGGNAGIKAQALRQLVAA